MAENLQNSLEEIASELAYIGEKLNDILMCLRKMSNWENSDDEKYDSSDDESGEDEEDEEN